MGQAGRWSRWVELLSFTLEAVMNLTSAPVVCERDVKVGHRSGMDKQLVQEPIPRPFR